MHRQAGSAARARQSHRLPPGSVCLCAAVVLMWLVAALPTAHARSTGYDGRFIAFERAGDIWAVTADGQSEAQLTSSPALERHPSWGFPVRWGSSTDCETQDNRPREPDARTIVYESASAAGPGDIVKATVTGGGAADGGPLTLSAVSAVTATGDLDEGDPAVGVVTAPLTPVVAFTAVGADQQRHIWVKRLDAPPLEPATRITSGPDDANPDWAGDGSSIAYDRSMPDGTRQIAIVDVAYDGTGFPAQAPVPRPVTFGPRSHTNPSRFDYSFDDNDDDTPDPVLRSRLLFTTSYAELGLDYLDYVQHDPAALILGPLFSPSAIPPPTLAGLTGDPGGDSAPSIQLPAEQLTPGSGIPGGGAAFQSTRDAPDNLDIDRVAADGTGVTRLTTDTRPDLDPDREPITQPDGGQCLEPLPGSPDPGPEPTRNGRARQTGDPGSPSDGPGITVIEPPPLRPMSVRQVHVKASGKGRRRAVVVSLVVDRPATARLRLTRGRRVLARRNYRLHGGGNRLRLAVPRKVKQGRCRLTITVRSTPFTYTTVRTVRLGR